MLDVSSIDLATHVLGRKAAMPVGLAPAALPGGTCGGAEVPVARAAARAGIPFCISTFSVCTLEEVASTGAGDRWFQLYIQKDRSITRDLVERAAAAGYRAIVLTVDIPVPGTRERDVRNELPAPDHFANLPGSEAHGQERDAFVRELNEQRLSWDDLSWLASLTDLPIVVKGVLTGEDAHLAVEHGAAAVVVSNHGGRQLDRVPATIDVLEEVAAAVAGRAEVYLDGGVRRGVDVLIALALGARAVFIGRPYLFAVSVAGEEGVARALGLLGAEVSTAMALLGISRPADITRAHVC